jgi:hypothetical protein
VTTATLPLSSVPFTADPMLSCNDEKIPSGGKNRRSLHYVSLRSGSAVLFPVDLL